MATNWNVLSNDRENPIEGYEHYSKEDMLKVFSRNLIAPDTLSQFPSIFSRALQTPMSMQPLTEDERLDNLELPINPKYPRRGHHRGRDDSKFEQRNRRRSSDHTGDDHGQFQRHRRGQERDQDRSPRDQDRPTTRTDRDRERFRPNMGWRERPSSKEDDFGKKSMTPRLEDDDGDDEESVWAMPSNDTSADFASGRFVSKETKPSQSSWKQPPSPKEHAADPKPTPVLPPPGLSVSPQPVEWVYLDSSGNSQGPFDAKQMTVWFENGFFNPELRVRPVRDDTTFRPLGSLRDQSMKHKVEPFLTAVPWDFFTHVTPVSIPKPEPESIPAQSVTSAWSVTPQSPVQTPAHPVLVQPQPFTPTKVATAQPSSRTVTPQKQLSNMLDRLKVSSSTDDEPPELAPDDQLIVLREEQAQIRRNAAVLTNRMTELQQAHSQLLRQPASPAVAQKAGQLVSEMTSIRSQYAQLQSRDKALLQQIQSLQAETTPSKPKQQPKSQKTPESSQTVQPQPVDTPSNNTGPWSNPAPVTTSAIISPPTNPQTDVADKTRTQAQKSTPAPEVVKQSKPASKPAQRKLKLEESKPTQKQHRTPQQPTSQPQQNPSDGPWATSASSPPQQAYQTQLAQTIAQQQKQQSKTPSTNHGVPWTSKSGSGSASLRDIQAEEERRAREQKRLADQQGRLHQQNVASQKSGWSSVPSRPTQLADIMKAEQKAQSSRPKGPSVPSSFSSAANTAIINDHSKPSVKTTPVKSWGPSSRQTSQPKPATKVTRTVSPVKQPISAPRKPVQEEDDDDDDEDGFWETPKESSKPTKTQTSTSNSSKQKPKKTKNSPMLDMQSEPRQLKPEFLQWCQRELSAFPEEVDVPTFVNFLMDIGSPNEIVDYVSEYLGSSDKARRFAKAFVDKRVTGIVQSGKGTSPIKTQTTTSTSTNDDSSWQKSGKGKSKKKKNKFTKVDPSLLKFN